MLTRVGQGRVQCLLWADQRGGVRCNACTFLTIKGMPPASSQNTSTFASERQWKNGMLLCGLTNEAECVVVLAHF